MAEHQCEYRQYKDLVFVCSKCNNVHHCGVNKCENLFYNENYTQICSLTGLCFNQKICDSFIDTKKGVLNTNDRLYFPQLKRNQQIKNKMFNMAMIHQLIRDIEDCTNFKMPKKIIVIKNLKRLWCEFIEKSIDQGLYIHRKDTRCFIVAVIFSLSTGIETSAGVVVHRHQGFDLKRINKKRAYTHFKISDIR